MNNPRSSVGAGACCPGSPWCDSRGGFHRQHRSADVSARGLVGGFHCRRRRRRCGLRAVEIPAKACRSRMRSSLLTAFSAGRARRSRSAGSPGMRWLALPRTAIVHRGSRFSRPSCTIERVARFLSHAASAGGRAGSRQSRLAAPVRDRTRARAGRSFAEIRGRPQGAQHQAVDLCRR